MLRIGSVPYLVARPLTAGLDNRPDVKLTFAPPSDLAEQLASGKLDVALASSILSIQNPEFRLWDQGPVVACEGAVQSVGFFLRPGISSLNDVKHIALDQHSRTGRELAQIILRERYSGEFQISEIGHQFNPIQEAMDNNWDAVQLIGDPAVRAQIEYSNWTYVDLGSEWFGLTALPFVFAGWIGREGFDPAYAAPTLESAAELGLSCLQEIADHAGQHFYTDTQVGGFDFHDYLNRSIKYQLPAEKIRESIDCFGDYLKITCNG